MTGFARDLVEVAEVRARRPERIAELFASRSRRPLLGDDGRLMVVACDHPARGALSVRGVPDVMASRSELLGRLTTALSRPGVDGLLATADIVEDLLLLGALEGKVIIGSMNRGGLSGTAFELDDRMTGYDVEGVAAAGLDGGKMLTRIDPDDVGTVRTLEACGRAVSGLAERGLLAMVEPFWCHRAGGRVVNELEAASVVRSVHVAQGLGNTSAHTWLKLPVVEDMERVMDATTLPTLLLGGDPTTEPGGHPDATYAEWAKALALPAVRGLVVGRALLFPLDDDVAGAVDTAVGLVRP